MKWLGCFVYLVTHATRHYRVVQAVGGLPVTSPFDLLERREVLTKAHFPAWQLLTRLPGRFNIVSLTFWLKCGLLVRE